MNCVVGCTCTLRLPPPTVSRKSKRMESLFRNALLPAHPTILLFLKVRDLPMAIRIVHHSLQNRGCFLREHNRNTNRNFLFPDRDRILLSSIDRPGSRIKERNYAERRMNRLFDSFEKSGLINHFRLSCYGGCLTRSQPCQTNFPCIYRILSNH